MSKKFALASTYPLQWPEGFPRAAKPGNSKFQTSLFGALENVQNSLRKFGSDSNRKVEQIVISSNYSLTETKPRDAGVAVYFVWDGEQTCIPVDRYKLVEDNLQAIHHCIEAKRTMLRHGGINLVKAAFRGYTALPNPETASETWRVVLGYFGSSLDEAKKAYQVMRSDNHPDNGGDRDMFAAVTRAWEQAKKELAA